MFTIISALSTPLVVINASAHYLTWQGVKKEDLDATIKTHRYANQCFSALIFLLGSGIALNVAYKLQNPTPLILTAMVLRIVACGAIALATCMSGAAVNHWCAAHIK